MLVYFPVMGMSERMNEKDTQNHSDDPFSSQSSQNLPHLKSAKLKPIHPPIFKIHSSEELEKLASSKLKESPTSNVANARAILDCLTRTIYGTPVTTSKIPLDQNLFTLQLHARTNSINSIDLVVENSYSNKSQGIERIYSIHKEGSTLSLLDPFSDSLYGTCTVLGTKLRLIQLESPSLAVEVKSTGLMSWEHSFTYEGLLYHWSRDITSLIGAERGFTLSVSRKPEPSWPVTLFRSGKSSNSSISIGSIQVLDYNYARLEPPVQDKKGLEIITILSLFSFTDHYFQTTSTSTTMTPIASTSNNLDPRSSAYLLTNQLNGSTSKILDPPLPTLPTRNNSASNSNDVGNKNSKPLNPKPPPSLNHSKKGSVKKELSLSANELEIKDSDSTGKLEEKTAKCLNLFTDPSLLYVTLIARSSKSVSVAIKLAEEVKRKRYKASAEELMQYILPLDDELPITNPTSKYTPPTSIKIFLSRIALDELLPLYKKKLPSSSSSSLMKPDIRPPIHLGSSSSGSLPSPSNGMSSNGKLEGKLKKDEKEREKEREKEKASGGGGGGLFGGFFGGGSGSTSSKAGEKK